MVVDRDRVDTREPSAHRDTITGADSARVVRRGTCCNRAHRASISCGGGCIGLRRHSPILRRPSVVVDWHRMGASQSGTESAGQHWFSGCNCSVDRQGWNGEDGMALGSLVDRRPWSVVLLPGWTDPDLANVVAAASKDRAFSRDPCCLRNRHRRRCYGPTGPAIIRLACCFR